VSEALGQMNVLSQSLCSLFPPRLPRFGREDVAGTAEYYNRLARNCEATINPPGMWMGRISAGRAVRMRIRPRKTALGTSNRKLPARPVWIDKDQWLSKVLNWARRLWSSCQRSRPSATFEKHFCHGAQR
jgi:hypothetical protein